jgi:hypothetical protein
MTDLGHPRDVERRNKAIKVRQGKTKDALRWIMSDQRGALYLAELVRETGAIDTTRVIPNTVDGAMVREGMRFIGLRIIADLQALDDLKPLGAVIAAVLKPEAGDKDGGRDDE